MTQSPDLKEVFDAAFEKALQIGQGQCAHRWPYRCWQKHAHQQIFHGNMAVTGQGKPVTQTTRLISKEGIPLSIWDTHGRQVARAYDFAPST